MSSPDVSAMQEKNEQTLKDIQDLQTIEKDLYAKMEKLSANNMLTQDQKDSIITKINEVSQLRMNLYSNLRNSYAFFQQDVITTGHTLDEQTAAVNIVEKELNDAKKRLQTIEDDKMSKMRYIEINTYYGKRYNDHSSVMKTIIYLAIPLLIISVLANKGIIPERIYKILVAIIIVIGIILVGTHVLYISNRDKMNYDQYNWYFDPASNGSSTSTSSSSSSSSDPWKLPGKTCIGEACCYDGSTYDSELNVCVKNDSTTTTSTSNSSTNSPNSSSNKRATEPMVGEMWTGDEYYDYSSSGSSADMIIKNKHSQADPVMNNYVVF